MAPHETILHLTSQIHVLQTHIASNELFLSLMIYVASYESILRHIFGNKNSSATLPDKESRNILPFTIKNLCLTFIWIITTLKSECQRY